MKINKETLVNIIKEELKKELVLQEGVKAKLTALTLAALMGLLGKVGSDAKEAVQNIKAEVKKLEDETAKKKALAAFLAGQLSQEELDKELKALGDK